MEKILVFCLILLAHQVHAEEPTWFLDAIKVKNPDQLAYWVSIHSNCPVKKEAIQNTIEEVFIRSRVKPLKEQIYKLGEIYLNISIVCIPDDDKEWHGAFHVSISFARFMPYPAVLFDYSFGGVATGDEEYMPIATKHYTEDAITAFIKANSDL